jgi:hypothetical protein
VEILDIKLIIRGNKPVAQVLVKWFGLAEEQALWKDYDVLQARYLLFDP